MSSRSPFAARSRRCAALLAALPLALAGAALPASAATAPGDPLRVLAPEGLKIGSAAAGGGHHLEADYPDPFSSDEELQELLATEFSSLSPENQMKWDYLEPERGVYDFAAADAIVAFAEANGQDVRGHTLLWHNQLPAWLTEGVTSGEIDDAELRSILENHIKTVVGRYKGQIDQWDVANEIFADEWDAGGVKLRTDPTQATANIFLQRLGPGIIDDAFRWAHEADPEAKLFLNDYAVEDLNTKSTAYYELAKGMLARGVPIDGFAFQAHLDLQYPFPTTLQANMQRFSDLGLETAITELDVRFTLPAGGVPTGEQLAAQASAYSGVLEACVATEGCNNFTVWGVNDRYSWVPTTFPGQGAATIAYEDFSLKPAYYAMQDLLAEEAGVPRIGGDDRYATAGEIARQVVSGIPVRNVVLANGEDSTMGVDALSASYLAGTVDDPTPILLTAAGSLPDATVSALRDVLVGGRDYTGSTIHIAGGTAAVSAPVEAELQRLFPGVAINRLAGGDRYETAAKAALLGATINPTIGTVSFEEGAEALPTAIVASGEVQADALAAGQVAYAGHHPLLLTGKGSVPAATVAALTELEITQVVLLGGEAAVSVEAEDAMLDAGISVLRIGGEDRYETATLLLDAASAAKADGGLGLGFANSPVAHLATGEGFADALSAGPLAGNAVSPLLLTQRDSMPPVTAAWIAGSAASGVVGIGLDEALPLQRLVEARDVADGADD